MGFRGGSGGDDDDDDDAVWCKGERSWRRGEEKDLCLFAHQLITAGFAVKGKRRSVLLHSFLNHLAGPAAYSALQTLALPLCSHTATPSPPTPAPEKKIHESDQAHR